MAKKAIIGRREKADFPVLELHQIDVKVDTGAYTSSIFCSTIRLAGNKLYCTFLSERFDTFQPREYEFDTFNIRQVKSSNGEVQQRYEIKTEIQIGGQLYPLQLTLSNRASMRYPVLLGRRFLKGKFVVDVSKTNKLL